MNEMSENYDIEGKIRELEKSLARLRQTYDDAQNENRDLQNEIQEMTSQNELLEEKCKRMAELTKGTQSHIDKLTKTLSELKSRVDTAESEAKSATHSLQKAPLQLQLKEDLIRLMAEQLDPNSEIHTTPRCTFTKTQRRYTQQRMFFCETCTQNRSLGCCEHCAKICHKGHKLTDKGIQPSFFCDCGAGDLPSPCFLMGPPE